MQRETAEGFGDSAGVVCPECGGDARVLRDMRLRPWRRAWWLVLIVWGVVVVATLAGASPWGQDRLGGDGYWDRLVSTGRQPLLADRPPLKIARVEGAGEGDPGAQAEVLAYIRRCVERDGPFGPGEHARFVTMGPSGTIIEDTKRGFGGRWYWRWAMTSVDDLHRSDSYGSAPYQFIPSPVRFFPLEFREVRHGGTQHITTTYNHWGVLAHLAVCMGIVYLVALLARLAGKRIGRLAKLALLMVLLIATSVYACLGPVHEQTIYSSGGIVGAETPWFSAPELRVMLDDTTGHEALFTMLNSSLGGAAEQSDLVYLKIDPGYASVEQHWICSLGRHAPLAGFTRTRCYEPGSVGQVGALIDPPSGARRGERFDMNGFYWWRVALGGERALSWVEFSPAYLCMLAVSFYWLRRGLRWGACRWIARRQRGRVTRDQCVFCGYPLSPGALTARFSPTDQLR